MRTSHGAVIRRTFSRTLLIVIGALLAYIALDIVHNGQLDGSILQAVRADRAPLAQPP